MASKEDFVSSATPVSLLERIRQSGEREAWDRFVDLYTPFLFYLANRVGLCGDAAEDLVQDIFAILLARLPTFTYAPGKSFRSWLRTVTLNKWRESLRKKAAQTTAQDLDWDSLQSRQDLDAIWEAEYHRLVAQRALELMRRDFSPTTWQTCWELVVKGRSANDVAAQFGISVGAVYSAKFRVLARLRNELSGLLD